MEKHLPPQPTGARYDADLIVLPVEKEQFAEFISGLLGKPQVIGRLVDGSFCLDKSDVTNVHALLTQRILGQNDSSLISFSARVFYSDNSSVMTNSYDDFMSYAEIRPLYSTGLELSWRWLVKFRGREVPEKQDVNLSFRASRKNTEGAFIFEDDLFPTHVSSAIFIRTAHTERSWGSDVDVLLKGFVENILHKEHPSRTFLRKHSQTLGVIFGAIIFASFMSLFYSIIDDVQNAQYAAAEHLWSNKDGSSISILGLKTDYLISQFRESITSASRTLPIILFIFSIAGGLLAGIFISAKISAQRPSYVALTKQSEVDRDKGIRKYEKEFMPAVWAAVGAVAVAIIARLIGAIIIKRYF